MLEIWHLLSSDAPTVAALWAIFFARAMHIDLPWHAPLILALGTWLIYVADRILDGHRPSPATALHERHHFHARHRIAFMSAAIPVSGMLVWLIVNKMSPVARREDTVLFLLSLLYLFLVHKPAANNRLRLPKELAVGAVFAAATAVPTWSRLESGRLALLPAIILFAALCWLNCVAIEGWENEPEPYTLAHSSITTRWAAPHLRMIALTLLAISGAMALAGVVCSPYMAPLYVAALSSFAILFIIERRRDKFSILSLRIAADVALLTPLLFLPFMA